LGRLAGIKKIISHEHNTYDFLSWKLKLVRKLIHPLISMTVCYTDVVEQQMFGSVHVISEKDLAASNYPRHGTIFNGIDLSELKKALTTVDKKAKRAELGIAENALIVSTVGRMIDWKGQESLIRAAAQYAQHPNNNPRIDTLIIGYGPDDQKLRSLAAELGVTGDTGSVTGDSGHVHFLGARTDVYELLAITDIFSLVLTYSDTITVTEAVGVAGLEAMAAGAAFIAADYPSAKKFVTNGQNGILVPPKDIDALASTIQTLAHDPAQREQLGKAAAQFVADTLDWSSLIHIYEKLYIILTNADPVHKSDLAV
jgi:glycosyltransferase involved in cell wall biosynthesis